MTVAATDLGLMDEGPVPGVQHEQPVTMHRAAALQCESVHVARDEGLVTLPRLRRLPLFACGFASGHAIVLADSRHIALEHAGAGLVELSGRIVDALERHVHAGGSPLARVTVGYSIAGRCAEWLSARHAGGSLQERLSNEPAALRSAVRQALDALPTGATDDCQWNAALQALALHEHDIHQRWSQRLHIPVFDMPHGAVLIRPMGDLVERFDDAEVPPMATVALT